MSDQPRAAELPISLEKVCYVVVRARQFDVKEDVVEADYGGNQADEGFRQVLENYGDDPTFDELVAFIRALDVDERCALIALTWVGRGDFTRDDWSEAVALARREHANHAAEYLIGTPLLADLLEEGLAAFDLDCIGDERNHL